MRPRDVGTWVEAFVAVECCANSQRLAPPMLGLTPRHIDSACTSRPSPPAQRHQRAFSRLRAQRIITWRFVRALAQRDVEQSALHRGRRVRDRAAACNPPASPFSRPSAGQPPSQHRDRGVRSGGMPMNRDLVVRLAAQRVVGTSIRSVIDLGDRRDD